MSQHAELIFSFYLKYVRFTRPSLYIVLDDVAHLNDRTGCLPNHLFQIPQFSQGFPDYFDKMLTATLVQRVLSGLRCLVTCQATLFSAATPTCNLCAIIGLCCTLPFHFHLSFLLTRNVFMVSFILPCPFNIICITREF